MLELADARRRSPSSTRSSATFPATRAASSPPARRASAPGADLVVTPELSLCGYPPEDLLLRPAFVDACAARARRAGRGASAARRADVGFPERDEGTLPQRRRGAARRPRRRTSTASSACRTTPCSTRSATSSRATSPCVFEVERRARRPHHLRGHLVPRARGAGARRPARRLLLGAERLAVPPRQQALRRAQACGARASENRPADRLRESGGRAGRAGLRRRVVRRSTPTATLAQQVPGVARDAGARARSTARRRGRCRGALDPRLEAHVYHALVMGVRDYVGKNRFPGVLLGLSGGIDSALTLAIAVDALGPRPRARGDDAVALHRADQPRGRARDGAASSACATTRSPIEADRSTRSCEALAPEFARPAAGHDRGEPPGAHPRHAADGAVEQVRLDRADHRQQERDGGRLRHALRRHGRRLRGAEGHRQDAGLPAVRTTATRSAA